ncbi:hypothetical protein EZS27_016212 [termite gut metagenome]|uniref:Uncharacterized protein n=1 Tax=termite gut metagenome TaxID=433724 RepID=A0A5J4RPK1_9ZZZZ
MHLQKKREEVKTNIWTIPPPKDAIIQKPKRNKPVSEFLIQRNEAVSQIQEQAQRFEYHQRSLNEVK